MTSTIVFSKDALIEAEKHERKPSLGVIQAKGQNFGKRWSRKEMTRFKVDPEYREGIRYGTVRAKNRALELNKELESRHSSGKDAADKFFRDKSVPKITSDGTIKIGTDCSGMEAPIQAITNLQIKHKHKFSCDIDEGCVKTITENYPPETLYDNVISRDNDQTPEVDVYAAGFPCQPFSTAGKQLGFDDMKDGGRGIIFFRVLKYLQSRRPKIFILENVKGIVSLEEGKYLKVILDALHAIGKPKSQPGETPGRGLYEIHWKVLNTREHGIPQNRERWYCVGIRRGVMKSTDSPFTFPKPIKCVKMEDLLDPISGEGVGSESKSVAENISKAEQTITDRGKGPSGKHFIVDCDASSSRVHWMEGIPPCITKARGRGHWITSKKRRFSKEEMFRLQGMDPTMFKVAVTETQLGQQIGNAMSVNVFERVLRQALIAAGLAKKEDLRDRWESGEAITVLEKTVGKTFKPMETSGPKPCKRRMYAKLGHGLTSRRFIVDSGASLHLVDLNTLSSEEKKQMCDLEIPISLQTANGVIVAKRWTWIWVKELEIYVKAIALGNSPPVLSLGKLVEENKFRYRWDPGRTPYLSANGNKYKCYPTHNVPFITAGTQAEPDAECGNAPGSASDIPPQAAPKEKPKKKKEKVPKSDSESSGPPDLEEDSGPPPLVDSSSESDAGGNSRRPPKVEPPPPPPKPHKEKRVRQRRVVSDVKICKHNPYTHFPKDPDCAICRACKTQRAQCKSCPKTKVDGLPEPKAFADAITADHAILNEDDASRDKDKVVCVIQDQHTHWLQAFADQGKSAEETKKALRRFLGPQTKAKHAYSDNSKELAKAFKDLDITHDTSTPYRPETNGVAERAVRRVKEGTACALVQSGFDELWLVFAMECYCYLRNIVDVLISNEIAYHRRFGENFKGPILPFGCEIRYKPITKDDIARCHKYGDKMLPGIFLGYDIQSGGGLERRPYCCRLG